MPIEQPLLNIWWLCQSFFVLPSEARRAIAACSITRPDEPSAIRHVLPNPNVIMLHARGTISNFTLIQEKPQKREMNSDSCYAVSNSLQIKSYQLDPRESKT